VNISGGRLAFVQTNAGYLPTDGCAARSLAGLASTWERGRCPAAAVHQTSATRWRVLYLYHQIRLTHALEGATIGCMAIEVSGEILRLLSILSDRSDGATQYELAVLEGVSASLIYKAVMLDLVYAQRQGDETYRYLLRETGRALLSPDERGSARGD
jgi:hypothetical protein